MKTIPTAMRVFGAHTCIFSGDPGGVGGLVPSDTHLRCRIVTFLLVRSSEALYVADSGDRVHDLIAASRYEGRAQLIVVCPEAQWPCNEARMRRKCRS